MTTVTTSKSALEPIGAQAAPVLDPKAVEKFIAKFGPQEEATPTLVDKRIKGSLIKPKYRERYKKHGFSCGDLLADELKEFLTVSEKGKPPYMCLDKLKVVATTNGVWETRYDALNKGQQRMTIGNRLRNKFNNGDKIDIGGVIIFDEALQLED